jgi:hypothetical protein
MLQAQHPNKPPAMTGGDSHPATRRKKHNETDSHANNFHMLIRLSRAINNSVVELD